MSWTKNDRRNYPVALIVEQRLENRKSELLNPTLTDTADGLNDGGSNANGIGIHTEVFNVACNAEDNWDRPTAAVVSQHLGTGQQTPEDYLVIGRVPISYQQATVDLAPGQQDPSAGTFNISGQTIPAGAWYWGTVAELPWDYRCIDNANTVRITSDGGFRIVML